MAVLRSVDRTHEAGELRRESKCIHFACAATVTSGTPFVSGSTPLFTPMARIWSTLHIDPTTNLSENTYWKGPPPELNRRRRLGAEPDQIRMRAVHHFARDASGMPFLRAGSSFPLGICIRIIRMRSVLQNAPERPPLKTTLKTSSFS